MKAKDVLKLRMPPNPAKAATVADYLKALLCELWEQGEDFSGKRPFGDSGWECDLWTAVIAGGASTGKLDEDGYVDDVGDAHQRIYDAIHALS